MEKTWVIRCIENDMGPKKCFSAKFRKIYKERNGKIENSDCFLACKRN